MKKINTKNLKFKVNNTVVIAFVVIGIILLNMVFSLAEDKLSFMRADLSRGEVTNITRETKALLRALDETDTQIEIIYLKGAGDVPTMEDYLLSGYESYSRNLVYKTENYLTNPMALTPFSVNAGQISDGTVIVTNKDRSRYKFVLPTDILKLESSVTNAVAYVMADETVNVSIATGYGSDEYISGLLEVMIDSNFSVSRIDLSTVYVPDEVDVLVIMSPYADLTESEIANVDNFVLRGGNLVVALPSTAASLPNLEAYLSYWGVSANADFIFERDENSSYEQMGTAFFAQNGESEITDGISGRILAYNARSLNFTPTGDIDCDVLLTTTEQAASLPQSENVSTEDINYGPFHIGYVLEKPLNGSYETTAKMIVTSTAEVWGVGSLESFLTETRFGNREFVTKAFSHASGKSVRSVAVPEKASSDVTLTLSKFQSFAFSLVLCLVIPAIVLIWGIAVWLKRRNK